MLERDLAVAALHGGVLAFGLILPIGPQNLFVFTSGAVNSLCRALIIASAAALSDTCLILVGVLGVSAVALELVIVKQALLIGGTIFLGYLGLKTWTTHSLGHASTPGSAKASLSRQIAVAFSASLLNPHAILDTVAVIGTSSLAYAGLPRVGFTSACIAVSWCWFAVLVVLGRGLGRLPFVARMSGKLSSLAMWACAVFLLLALLRT